MTIKDIARACGVSVSTVSRVLNNRPDVSPAVRTAVLDMVERSHYIPNNSARDLVKSRSDAIGVVVRGVSNPFFAEILKTVETEIDAAGYTMVMQQISDDGDEIKRGAIMEREKKLRGVIFMGGRSDYRPAEVKLLTVPFVCCAYTNSFGTLPEEDYSSVSIQDEEAGAQAVRTLCGLGHRRIAALLSGTGDRSISELRYLGYARALKACGLEPEERLVESAGSFAMDAAYDAMRRLMARASDFTAVFTISDTMAIAAMKALHDGGRPVPEACSVIAIDGIPLSEYVRPTLTTFCQPTAQMGAESVRILVDMIEGRSGNRHVTVETDFRSGGSVRAI